MLTMWLCSKAGVGQFGCEPHHVVGDLEATEGLGAATARALVPVNMFALPGRQGRASFTCCRVPGADTSPGLHYDVNNLGHYICYHWKAFNFVLIYFCVISLFWCLFLKTIEPKAMFEIYTVTNRKFLFR